MHWIYAHLIGDYIIQNDWMAMNKKKSRIHCIVHVSTYMLPFLLCGLNLWQFVAIALQHYLIDGTNFVGWFMGIKGSKQFRDGPLSPWSWVVIDNILHILWIAFIVWIPIKN
jgi:hypothetical protein